MILIRVDFPAPFGPKSPKNEPLGISRSIPANASLPGGSGLEPRRTLIWIERGRADRLEHARPLSLHLDPTLLAEPWIALVAFDDIGVPQPMPL